MKSTRCRQFFVAMLLLVVVFSAASSAEEAPSGIEPSLIIEQFEIFNDGDLVLVPVKVFGKTRTFMVDTCSSYQVYDKTLRPLLGTPRKTKTANTATGKSAVEVFDAPAATLGGLDLRTEWPVACFDFATLRLASGHEVEGVVGMAFLHQFIVQFDFEAGKLIFLREVPKNAGRRIVFAWKNATPRIRGQVQGAKAEYFAIDTGCVGPGCVGSELFESLVKQGAATATGNSLILGVFGKAKVRDGYIEGISLANVTLSKVPITALQDGHSNVLGLQFWTRFTLTFDFPHQVVFLKPNRNFGQPFLDDIDGMTFIRKDGLTVVQSLESSGPAAKAGIQKGDRLLEIDELDATTTRLFTLRQKLRVTGATVHVKLKRGDEIIDVDLELPKAEQMHGDEAKMASGSERAAQATEGMQR